MYELRHSRSLRALDEVDGLGHLSVEIETFGSQGGHLNREDGADTRGGPHHRIAIVEVTGNQIGAQRLDGLGSLGVGVTHQSAYGNACSEQGAGGGAALPAGGAGDQDRCGICRHSAPQGHKRRGSPFSVRYDMAGPAI
ncbi:hypothetical protein GCM10023096_24930 [Nonomuraea ferruginea]